MGYLAYFLAIRFSNATTGSVAFFMKPVLAPAFAVLILRETLAWNSFLGIALILVSSFIIIRSNAAKAARH
jgi:drug/metabolite transporter (DMT)-like permease